MLWVLIALGWVDLGLWLDFGFRGVILVFGFLNCLSVIGLHSVGWVWWLGWILVGYDDGFGMCENGRG